MMPEEQVYYPIYDNKSLINYAMSEEGLKQKWGAILVKIAQALVKADYMNLPIVRRKAGLDNKILAWMNHVFCEVPANVNADIFDVNIVSLKSYISEANQVMTHDSLSVPKGEAIEQYFMFYLGWLNEVNHFNKVGKLQEMTKEAGRFNEFFEEVEDGKTKPIDGYHAWRKMYAIPPLEIIDKCSIHKRGQRTNDFCLHEIFDVTEVPEKFKQVIDYKSFFASINVKWNLSEKNKRMRITPENLYNPTYVLVLDTMPNKTSQRLPSTLIRFGKIPDDEDAIMLRDIPVIPPTENYVMEASLHILEEFYKIQRENKKKERKNQVYTIERKFGI